MIESRTKNATKNIVSGSLNKVVNLLLPFISRTAILYILGSEYLGLGSLFTSVLQMLNMTELGFSSAIVFSLYKPLAAEDTDSVCGLMSYYRKVYFILSAVIFVIGVAITPFLPYLIKGNPPSGINIYVIYINAFNSIVIGNDVTISAHASIISTGIDYMSWFAGEKKRHIKSDGILIADHVWIGAGAYILDGVRITGNYVVIAAGAVVTKDIIDDYVVYAGCPAVVIKHAER